MRSGWLVLLLALPLAADVVILKDGTRYTGQVAEKGDAYEITTKHGTLTVQKGEVDRIVKDPKDVLKDADALREEAKTRYEEGCAKSDPLDRNSTLDAAIKLLEKARQIYNDTRMDFPEPAYNWMDDEILAIGQAIKLARDKHVLGDARSDSVRKEYEVRRAGIKAGDAEGHFVLAGWCEAHGLPADARAEYEETVSINPGHAKAREKLGHVLYEGKWMTKEERDRLATTKPPDKAPDQPPDNPPPAVDPSAKLIADLMSGAPSARIAAEAALRDPALPLASLGKVIDALDAAGQKEGVQLAARVCLCSAKQEAQDKAKGLLMRHKKLATAYVARQLGVTTPDQRLRVVRLLEELRTRDAVRALIAMGCASSDLDAKRRDVAEACIEAIKRIGRPAVPFLIEVLPNEALKRQAALLLFAITGESRGSEAASEYQAWWKGHRTPEDDLKDE